MSRSPPRCPRLSGWRAARRRRGDVAGGAGQPLLCRGGEPASRDARAGQGDGRGLAARTGVYPT
eukprot:8866119-Pyramimonas_sp.AAC.1